jgi:hypothetical protein
MGSFKTYYQNLVEERLDIASHIVEEIDNLDQSNVAEFIKQMEGLLSSKGEHIDSGIFADVYGGKTGGYVVRISEDDRRYHQFFEGIGGIANPIFPKILHGKQYKIDTTTIGVYIIQRLKVDRDFNYKLIDTLKEEIGMDLKGIISRLAEGGHLYRDQIDKVDAVLKQVNRSYDDLRDFAMHLSKIVGNTRNDAHGGNFGFDNEGGLVIFDPIS